MATSEELLKAYLDAEEHYAKERSRFVAIWSPGKPKPATEPLNEKTLARLRELGDDVNAKRLAWLHSYGPGTN